MRRRLCLCLVSGWAASLAIQAQAQAQAIVLASTTSTEQSGLFAYLLPRFTQTTGIAVKVVAVGSGQAIDMARRGDADVLLAHDLPAEEKLVAQGWVLARLPVMQNDFVLIGPPADPARVRGQGVAQALSQLISSGQPFISRGDRSGTHAAELRFWKLAGVDVPGFAGYRACGCGMGQALNMAASLGAYVLADRGTWLSFANRADLQLLVEGGKHLLNPYGVMVVNPARHPHVKLAQSQRFVAWLTGPAGQAAIEGFLIQGQPLFLPHLPQK